MKKKANITMIALTLVLVGFICAQFAPYFQYSENQSVSLASYIWFPTDHVDVTQYISSGVEGYNINNILGCGIMLPLAAIALVILLWKFQDNIVVILATGIWGIWGIIGYTANAALRLGGFVKLLLIVMFAAAILLSVTYILSWVRENKQIRRIGKINGGNTKEKYAV